MGKRLRRGHLHRRHNLHRGGHPAARLRVRQVDRGRLHGEHQRDLHLHGDATTATWSPSSGSRGCTGTAPRTCPSTAGYTGDGGTSRSKGGHYLYLNAEDVVARRAQIAWSTDRPIDLTGVQYVAFSGRTPASNLGDTESYLIAGTNSGRQAGGLQERPQVPAHRQLRHPAIDRPGRLRHQRGPLHQGTRPRETHTQRQQVHDLRLQDMARAAATTTEINVGTSTDARADAGRLRPPADEIYETGTSCTVNADRARNSGVHSVRELAPGWVALRRTVTVSAAAHGTTARCTVTSGRTGAASMDRSSSYRSQLPFTLTVIGISG